jgi:hypothetical protein
MGKKSANQSATTPSTQSHDDIGSSSAESTNDTALPPTDNQSPVEPSLYAILDVPVDATASNFLSSFILISQLF